MKTATYSLLAAIGVIWFSSPLLTAYGASEKPIALTYSTFFRITDMQAQLAEQWAKEIEKRTNGKIAIKYRPGGALLKGDLTYDGVKKGIADIGMSVFAYNRGAFPVMEAIDLPLGYPSGKVATAVINDFFRKFQPKELAGTKVLYLHAHGPGLLHSKKPVDKMEDLKGMKIRSTGSAAKMVKALGAVPVAVTQGEVYSALQNNLVDGTFSPMEVLKAWKQGEVIKYTIECYCVGYTSGQYVVMNLKKWNALPSDVKKVFEEVSAEWISKHGEAWDATDEEGRSYTLSLGNKIVPLSDELKDRWVKAVEPVAGEYVKEVDKKKIPGKQLVETVRSLIAQHTGK